MFKPVFTETATNHGGRNGHVKSESGNIDLDMRMPEAAGGTGKGANPEELFAAGYASCFGGTLEFLSGKMDIDVEGYEVVAHVTFGQENGGFGIQVKLDVSIPDLDKADAEKIVKAAHENCPYSKATKGNIEVDVNIV